jgi:hypothetical protein
MYRMHKCLSFKIEFPFEQRSILHEYNIECLLCPRNEKIGSNVNKKKRKEKKMHRTFLLKRSKGHK